MSVELTKDVIKLGAGALVVSLVLAGSLAWTLGLAIVLLGGVVSVKL